jgi:hypothetical protein
MEILTSVVFRICGYFILAAVSGVDKASANSVDQERPETYRMLKFAVCCQSGVHLSDKMQCACYLYEIRQELC